MVIFKSTEANCATVVPGRGACESPAGSKIGRVRGLWKTSAYKKVLSADVLIFVISAFPAKV